MKYDSRNLKYGSTSVIVSVVLIASIILVNFVLTALSSKYSFYTDMTRNSTYTITKELKEVLSDVTEEVNIIFCHDKDYIEDSSELHDVMLTAEYMAEEFEWLNIKYINSINEPQLVSKYKTSIKDPVYTSHVIIESGDEWKKLNAKSFYVVDTDNTTIWGLQAEERFASAILSVTAAEQPIAYYTNTHGEEMSLTLMDIMAVDDTILDDLDRKLNSRKLGQFIREELSDREKTVILLRYGLGGTEPLTQKEIAKQLGISRSYVSRIETKALKKLKKRFDSSSNLR